MILSYKLLKGAIKQMKKLGLAFQIVLGLILGIIVGAVFMVIQLLLHIYNHLEIFL